jgi:hypothetical protein
MLVSRPLTTPKILGGEARGRKRSAWPPNGIINLAEGDAEGRLKLRFDENLGLLAYSPNDLLAVTRGLKSFS